MRSSLREAIIKTIAYGDIFQYPLQAKEIAHRLVGIRAQEQDIRKELHHIKQIEEKGGYYFFKGKKTLVTLHKRRMHWSKRKRAIAQRAAGMLGHIPTLKLIGISGGLACNNTDEDDDIDFFLITTGGRIWTTRLLVTGVLEYLGVRRRPDDRAVQDTICVNMLIDEDHLALPDTERDLFGAYETVLMQPILQRDRIYDRFLLENQWVRKWLPNWESTALPQEKKSLRTADKPTLRDNGVYHPASCVEWMSRLVQLRYMNTRRTTERIGDGRVCFHPHDARRWVMEEYRKTLRRCRGI